MTIADRIGAVRAQIAAAAKRCGRSSASVALLAVSKTHPAAAVRAAHAAGQRAFGENRVQELAAKASELADLPDVRWHLIGSLQTNKVRELLAVPNLELVHSLDRVSLADELQRQLARTGRRLGVLLQANVTGEANKHGVAPAAALDLLDKVLHDAPLLAVQGVMAMGPLDGDPVPAFAAAAALRDRLRATSGLPLPVLSLGMSGDLDAAIAAGSTLVRIGTGVFGARG